MSESLPLRPNLEWLKKLSKDRLAALRARDPRAKLSDAQLAVARQYGFSSWRKLKAHVETVQNEVGKVSPVDASQEPASPGDPELGELLAAVERGDIDRVTQLLKRRPILARSHGPEGQTPLHAAAWYNDARLAEALLTYGADPEAKYGESGHTALSWAVTCSSLDFANALVQRGSKPDLFCSAGIGSVEYLQSWFDSKGALRPGAARTGSSRLAANGKRLPCPPTTPIEQISDALYIASRNGQVEAVRFLVTKQPDLSFRAYMGGTPLHWAYFSGSKAVIELLKQAGADENARDDVLKCKPRSFGICVPASWGMADDVRDRLAEDPALVNLMDGSTSPLHEAARNGHGDIVQLLLAAGADPQLRNGEGKTPAELAADSGHAAVAQSLMRAGN
jgi:cytohesin